MELFKDIYFDSKNPNCLIIINNDNKKCYIAIPPGKNRIDLISFEDLYHPTIGYEYKYNGLVIVTKTLDRYILDNKGEQIAYTFLNKIEVKFDVDDESHPWNWKK